MNIREMPAGRELDALVAEKVFNKPPSYYNCPHFDENGRILSFCSCPSLPLYSTDIAAALIALEEISRRMSRGDLQDSEFQFMTLICLGCADSVSGGYVATHGYIEDFIYDDPDWTENANDYPCTAEAPTAALAICRAMLLLMEAINDD